MVRQLVEIELEEAKDKLVGSPSDDLPRLQGGARVLRFLLDVLSRPPSELPVMESNNG